MSIFMLKRPLSLICLLTLWLSGGPVAVAQQPPANAVKGFFASLSTGASAINLDSIAEPEQGDTDRDSLVGKVTLGYWLGPHLGVSAEYLDLGKFKQRYPSAVFQGSARSYGASVMARLPLGKRWALIGKASFTHTSMRNRGSTSRLFDDLIGSDTQLVLPSVEVNYHLTPRIALTLEVDHRGGAAKDVELGYLGIGAKVQF